MSRCCAVALQLVLLFLTGCGEPDQTETWIALRYRAADQSPALHFVRIISGIDKQHWFNLAPGRVVYARLSAGSNADTRVILFQQPARDSETRTWRGPAWRNDKSHRIALDLYPDGRVEARFCELPCSLD